MKQLLLLSGKGGTGKTTLAGEFIRLHEAKAYADCDVDAPNLHLITAAEALPETEPYYGMPKARIHAELCIACDRCRSACRFGAVIRESSIYSIDPHACEGCGVCEAVCEAGAITMTPSVAGELQLYHDTRRTFSTARLKMGSGTSGLLVTRVKSRLKDTAPQGIDLAIIDGSPGIGCPVIASLSGVDWVLLVAEPSLSGLSDLHRVAITAAKLGVPAAVCVNKHDTNEMLTQKIKDYCEENDLHYVGSIPYEPKAVKHAHHGQTASAEGSAFSIAAKAVYERILALLSEEGTG